MASAELIARMLAFVLTIVIARNFGASAFGELSVAQIIGTYISILVVFGLNTIGIRELAKNEFAETIVTNIHKIKLAFFLVTNVISVVIYFMTSYDPHTKLLVLLYIFSSSLLAVMDLSWVFNGFSMMKYTSLVRIFQQFLFVLLAAVLLYITPLGVLALPIALAVSALVTGVYAIYLLKRSKLISSMNFKEMFNFTRFSLNEIKLFTSSAKIFLSAILVQVYTSSGALIVSHYHSAAVVGLLNANLKITILLVAIPGIIITVLFPLLSGANDARRKELFNSSLKTMIVIALPISIGGVITSYHLIGLLYGAEFLGASASFKILIVGMFFSFINYVLGYLLISHNSEKMFLRMVIISSVVNMSLNFLFIPRFGIIAASATSVLAELIITIGYSYKIYRLQFFSIDTGWIGRMAFVSFLFAAIVMTFNYFTPIIVTLAMSCISYALLVYFFRLTPFIARPKKVLQANAL
jgi:O-antigen/teichoic acid export membrane protein